MLLTPRDSPPAAWERTAWTGSPVSSQLSKVCAVCVYVCVFNLLFLARSLPQPHSLRTSGTQRVSEGAGRGSSAGRRFRDRVRPPLPE